MTRTLLGAALATLLASSAAPANVRAYSDPLLFKADPLQGGGGGRLFTGSPADAYSCKVCHRGGTPPKVEIAGLPLDGFVPGARYDIQLSWDNLKPHAMAIEFTTLDGLGAGTLELVEANLVGASGRCGNQPDAQVASGITQEGTRTIVLVPDCGATSLRVHYTAPLDGPEIIFAGGVVASDDSQTFDGDGVLELRRTLRAVGAPQSSMSGGCNVAAANAVEASSLVWWLLAALGLRRRSFTSSRG